MDRPQRDRPASGETQDGIPRAAVAAWAAGSRAPAGRWGKKTRRRMRKIAAALATILVITSVGTTAALAEASFYRASPYVDNRELVEAGSKTFDERLAVGQPERTEEPAIAARTLEDAIVSGGLSPDDMEMPDMMLAGISGDQMALAAAEDDDASPGVGPAATPEGEGPNDALADADTDTAVGTAVKGPATDATVGDLAEHAAAENPDGYASPALGGDPEPIVEEYAADDDAGDAGDPAPADGPLAPSGVELASADTGETTPGAVPISDTGASDTAPTSEPVAGEEGTKPEEAQSDELSYTPVSGDDGPEESHYDPEDSAEGEEPATSAASPTVPQDDSGTGLASAEEGFSGEASSEDAYPSDRSGASGYSEAPSEDGPPEHAASDEAQIADAPSPYDFEEETDDYAQGTPPDHSSVSEHATGEPEGAQEGGDLEESPEPGPQHQIAAVASGYQGSSEDAPPERPPGQETEQGYGQGHGRDEDDAAPEQAEAEAAGDDQTFSDPEDAAEDQQAPDAEPQVPEGQQPESDTPPAHGQEGQSEPAPAPEGATIGNSGSNGEGGQDGASSEEGSGAARPAAQGSDGVPPSAAGDAPARDRPQRPQQERSPERRTAAQQPAPAEAARTHEARPATSRAEPGEDRQAELQSQRRDERRAEFQAVREDRKAERKATQQEARRTQRIEDRQAELRASRRAERTEAREVAAQEAAAVESADRAALRRQRRAEQSAAEAAEVRGSADPAQHRNLPGAGEQRWDAPAVEPSLPAQRSSARRWVRPQPVEPVIADPAYEKPVPVRTGSAAGGNFGTRSRATANPVAAKTSPVPVRQNGGDGVGGVGALKGVMP